MTAKVVRTLLVSTVALTSLVGCSADEPAPTAVRARDVVLEGDVRELVDRDGVRVGGTEDGGRGVLVLLLERRAVDLRDRVRVVGEQAVLQLAAMRDSYGLDLDGGRYRRLEGEEVIVAHTVTVLAAR